MTNFLFWTCSLLMLSFLLTDLIRVNITGQSIFISIVPLVIALIGCASTIMSLKWKFVRKNKQLIKSIKLLIFFGFFSSIVAVIKNVNIMQIIAGNISFLGPIPGIILGYGIAVNKSDTVKIAILALLILLISFSFAILQQFGLLGVTIDVLEGTPETRGVTGFGQFKYIPGPFRNPSIFSSFIAFSVLIVVMGLYEVKIKFINFLSRTIFFIVTLFISLLAARRSGTIMLIGAILPYILSKDIRRKLIPFIALIIILSPVLFFFIKDISKDTTIYTKAMHFTIHSGIEDRLTNIFNLDKGDWELLEWEGSGIGTAGQAVNMGGKQKAYLAKIQLERHPVLHYGWFKDLYIGGLLGLILHTFFFIYLYKSCWPRQFRKTRLNNAYPNGSLMVACVAIVYFFIATSWIHSVTGGVLFGFSSGFAAGVVNRKSNNNIENDLY